MPNTKDDEYLEKFRNARDALDQIYDQADGYSQEELSQQLDAFVAEFGREYLYDLLLRDGLRWSNAGMAAQLMLCLWLCEEEQQWEMICFLQKNPDATEGQILHKYRKIQGEQW